MQESYAFCNPECATTCWDSDGARVLPLFIFNTEVSLHLYPEQENDVHQVSKLDEALYACRDRCVFFEHTLSRTRPDSDLARAHGASPHPVTVSPCTAELVALAQSYGQASGGLFDVTMGTLTQLWDFHEGKIPSMQQLAAAVPHVGMQKVHVGRDAAGVTTLALDDPATVLDLGGIAKGYIADDLAGLLVARGFERFVLNLGGNVVVHGGRPPMARRRSLHAPEPRQEDRAASHREIPYAPVRPWRIGIINPFNPEHFRALLDIRDGSVVTSGVHERSFEHEGTFYHHILDPRTGMPAQTDVVSATIVAARSLDCDGYSTAVLMMGVARGLKFVEGLPGVEAVLIDEHDEVHWTDGIAEALSLVPSLPM